MTEMECSQSDRAAAMFGASWSDTSGRRLQAAAPQVDRPTRAVLELRTCIL